MILDDPLIFIKSLDPCEALEINRRFRGQIRATYAEDGGCFAFYDGRMASAITFMVPSPSKGSNISRPNLWITGIYPQFGCRDLLADQLMLLEEYALDQGLPGIVMLEPIDPFLLSHDYYIQECKRNFDDRSSDKTFAVKLM